MYESILNFDNISDVGEISQYIIERFYNEKGDLDKVKLNIQDNIIINIYKYKNDFPLIINEVKKLFRTSNITTYNIVKIDGVKYLAYENLNNIPLKEYNIDSGFFVRQIIKNTICLNHLLCINSNYDNKLFVFPTHFNPFLIDVKNSKYVVLKSIKEKSFKYDIMTHEIYKSILDKWFDGSVEEFMKICKNIANEMNPNVLRQEMLSICRKYNDDYVSWVNSVYNKIIEAKEY